MSATYIGLNTIFTTELSHTQNSDLSVIVNWKQRIWATEAFTAPILGAVYSYLGSVNVRVIRVVITKTIGAFTDIETTLEGAGLSNPSASSGTQESIGALTEEPIQTHPNFSSIVALATTAGVTFDENQNLSYYCISLMIGLSEGMSLVTGPKLIAMEYGNKQITNSLIIYRLLYLIFVRMLFIWPSLIYYYHTITIKCDKYKDDRNILLVIGLVIVIIHAEINWLHSGRKELTRI